MDTYHNFAVVIGINEYEGGGGFSKLKAPINDANWVAQALVWHGYSDLALLTNAEATTERLNAKLDEVAKKVKKVKEESPNGRTRVLFYFAGHGVAEDEDATMKRPTGYIVPQDGRKEVFSTYLQMETLRDKLTSIDAHHLFVVLDCCNSGAFQFGNSRRGGVRKDSAELTYERYVRYLKHPAYQVLTSAAFNETAADVDIRGDEEEPSPGWSKWPTFPNDKGPHSPFARAFVNGLKGAANGPFGNNKKDGIITASELLPYIKTTLGSEGGFEQIPKLFSLNDLDKGEFIFYLPGADPAKLKRADENNPWPERYEEKDAEVFRGRKSITEKLAAAVGSNAVTVVVGDSGSGKSSLVRAGLVPSLKKTAPLAWQIMSPVDHPSEALAKVANFKKLQPAGQPLLIVDQLEQLPDCNKQKFFGELGHAVKSGLKVVFTLRSDYEQNFKAEFEQFKPYGRIQLELMTDNELKSVIWEPMEIRGLDFADEKQQEEDLLTGVTGNPAALPLLSCALREMYNQWFKTDREIRTLRPIDHGASGGVTGCVDRLWEGVMASNQDLAYPQTLKWLTLRMVPTEYMKDPSVLGKERDFSNPEENKRVQDALNALVGARLVVAGWDEKKKQETFKLAHKNLPTKWKGFVDKDEEKRNLLSRLTAGTRNWETEKRRWTMSWALSQYLWRANALRKESPNRLNGRETEFIRKSRNVLAGGVCAAVMLTATLMLSVFLLQSRREKQNVNEQRLTSYVELGRRELVQGEPLRAFAYLSRAYVDTKNSLTLPLLTMLANVAKTADAQFLSLEGHTDAIESAAFSSDGKYIVTASRDMTAKVWDAHSGKLLCTTKPHDKGLSNVAFSSDGKYIATASRDTTAKIWDALSCENKRTLTGHEAGLTSVAFSYDGKYILTASWDMTARVWDANTGVQQQEITTDGWIASASFSKDAKRIVVADWDHEQVIVFDLKTGEELWSGEHSDRVVSAAYSSDGKYIVTASWDNTARVWDATTGKRRSHLKGHTDKLTSAAFSEDGQRVVTASWDNTARVWDTVSGMELLRFLGHQDLIHSAAFSADGKFVVTASADKTAKVWDAARGNNFRTLSAHWDTKGSVAFSADGSRMVAVVSDTAKVWDLVSEKELRTVGIPKEKVARIAVSANGKYVVTASCETPGNPCTIRVWDVDHPKELRTFAGPKEQVVSAAISSNGTYFAATVEADENARVDVWNEDKPLPILDSKGVKFTSVAFSRDNTLLVASEGKIAKLWHLESNTKPQILLGHREQVESAAFSPDGQHVVTASSDRTAKVWDAKNGKEEFTLRGHRDKVTGAVFNEEGTLLVTTSIDNTAKVWDSESGTELLTLGGNQVGLGSAAFSADGKHVVHVVTANSDGTVTTWDIGKEPPARSKIAELICRRDMLHLDEKGHMQSSPPQPSECPPGMPARQVGSDPVDGGSSYGEANIKPDTGTSRIQTKDSHVNAGPIWDNDDARVKCPLVCPPRVWHGHWYTDIPDRMSVCHCDP